MRKAGHYEWLPEGRWAQTGLFSFWILFFLWQFAASDEGPVDHLVSVVMMIVAAGLALTRPAHRVRADSYGLHVRRGTWRTTTIPWSDAASVGRGRGIRRGEWVLTTSDGRRIPTNIQSPGHPDLAVHVRVMTGRATLEDYASLDDEDYAESR